MPPVELDYSLDSPHMDEILGRLDDRRQRPCISGLRSSMRAIVLSAGQGKRLLPLTATKPKCLLEVRDRRTLLDQQLQTLARCGVEQATVLTGFGADHVARFIDQSRFGSRTSSSTAVSAEEPSV